MKLAQLQITICRSANIHITPTYTGLQNKDKDVIINADAIDIEKQWHTQVSKDWKGGILQ